METFSPGPSAPSVNTPQQTPRDRYSWTARLIEMARVAAKHPERAGAWSTGERCAVALLVNRAEILPPGYTFIDAVARIMGDPILEDALQVNLKGWQE